MKDGFKIVYHFCSENNINNMEDFVKKLPIFPNVIQKILAMKHTEFYFDREDMERLFIWLMREDENQPRA
tara:strand:+ start:260 stop:469 length:210 start_codon:yes stop_codon:yes gene_type:complete